MNKKSNPIIGYHAYDHNYHIITPDGNLNPVFYSKEQALQAAANYGKEQEVLDVTALHLDGILSIILNDTGDIMLDGRAARRFVKGCKRRRISIDRKMRKSVQIRESKPIYSCRQLLEG